MHPLPPLGSTRLESVGRFVARRIIISGAFIRIQEFRVQFSQKQASGCGTVNTRALMPDGFKIEIAEPGERTPYNFDNRLTRQDDVITGFTRRCGCICRPRPNLANFNPWHR
ncbi:hypothetical protein CBL_06116 [Carabus blaptoides fortunei]